MFAFFSTGPHYTITFGTTSTKVSFRKTKMGKQNDNVSMEWWGGRIRKLTVRPPHLWQQRFEDRPMTIFHSLSIFWTVIFGGFLNKHCFDLFLRMFGNLLTFCRSCLLSLTGILWCKFWFSISTPPDDCEMISHMSFWRSIVTFWDLDMSLARGYLCQFWAFNIMQHLLLFFMPALLHVNSFRNFTNYFNTTTHQIVLSLPNTPTSSNQTELEVDCSAWLGVMDVEWELVLMDLRLNTLDFLKPAASETGSKEKSLINYLSFLIWDETSPKSQLPYIWAIIETASPSCPLI